MSNTKQSQTLFSTLQELFQCGSMSTVFEDETNSILQTPTPSYTSFQDIPQENDFPSREKLREMVLPMMPKRQQTTSFSSVASIPSILCGSVTNVQDETTPQEPRDESPPTPRTVDIHNKPSSNKKNVSYRYVIRLSPDETKYMKQKQLSREYSDVTLRRTQSDSMSTLPGLTLSSSSTSSVSRE